MRLVACGVVCPGEKRSLAAVNSSSPVVSRKDACCGRSRCQDDGCGRDARDGVVVAAYPSLAVDVRRVGPDESRGDTDGLYPRGIIVHLVNRVLDGWVFLHIQVQ